MKFLLALSLFLSMSCTAFEMDMNKLSHELYYWDSNGERWPLVTPLDLYRSPLSVGQSTYAFSLNIKNVALGVYHFFHGTYATVEAKLAYRERLVKEYINLVLMHCDEKIRVLNNDPTPDPDYEVKLKALKAERKAYYYELWHVE